MRAKRYQSLVQQRKACRLCEGLTNPADPACAAYDVADIGPWTRWQNSLSATLMVVGQDWGDVDYFVSHRGLDEPVGNSTNDNLRKLLKSIGLNAEPPGSPIRNPDLFFTNLVLCLKSGGLQGPVKNNWFRNCARGFFGELLAIVQPRVVVALGAHPSRAILSHFGQGSPVGRPLRELVASAPYRLTEHGPLLFPVFHCGARGVNQNRRFDRQLADWEQIRGHLESDA